MNNYSQDIPFKWSAEVGKDPTEAIADIYQLANKSWIVTKQIEDKKNTFSFDVLDSNQNIIHQNKVTLTVRKINSFGVLNDQFYVFGIVDNKGKDNLVAYQINLTDGSISKEISIIEKPAHGGYHCNFYVSISPDEKYCGISCSAAYSPEEKEDVFVKLFDADFAEIYSKTIHTTIPSAKKRINVLVTNNNGISYLMKRERIKRKNTYEIFVINKSGSVDNSDIHLKTKQITGMDYLLDEDGALYLSGYYSGFNKHNFEGIYIAKFKASSKSLFIKEYILNAPVVETFKSKKEIKEQGFGLDRFNLKDMQFVNDKTILLTVEHHSLNKSKSGPEDYRKGFVAIKLTTSGGFKSATPIITEQTDGKTFGYWSSFQIVISNNLPIIFANMIGEGGKKVKNSEQVKAGLPVRQITLDTQGNPSDGYPVLAAPVNQYCVSTTFSNNTSQEILCVESLDRKSYAIGVIATDE